MKIPLPTLDEFQKFDKAMGKILSVSKEELDRRLKAAKKAKKGKRYPKVGNKQQNKLVP